MGYFLGIDSSTTAAKALLMDADGRIIALGSSEYPCDAPRPGWSEQPAEAFWHGSVRAIQAVLAQSAIPADQVKAIGLTGQMHGMTLLDRAGQVIRPVILWNDQRTAAQCASITAAAGGPERVIAHTGNPMLTGFTAPKLAWTREHEPANYARAAHLLLPKDYVRYRLSGERATDMSDASGTGLFDVAHRQWSLPMASAAGVDLSLLPRAVEGTELCAQVSAAAARLTGLRAGTPIVGGGGDQAAGAVGMGIIQDGAVSLTLGTSGVVFASSDQYRADPNGRLHAFCHAVPGKWHLMGVMLSAAGSLRWWRDALSLSAAERPTYDRLTALAAEAPAGCEGLVFLPYLTGERTPHNDPEARGAFVGLTARHTAAHLTRAVLEGVAYGLRDSLELVRALGLPVAPVRATGGGIKSALWRQILADVLQASLVTVNSTEGAAYGAAILAAVGVGNWRDVPQACAATIQETGVCSPGGPTPEYAAGYARYRALYPALRS
jgi:xylulokinase